MNEIEYVKSRIKDIEAALQDSSLPHEIIKIQQTALLNYKTELSRLTEKSF